MKEEPRKLIRGTLCILKKDEKYLMRWETKGFNKDFLIFPGGSYEKVQLVERTELGAECAARETLEETGIRPIDLKLRATIFFDNKRGIFPDKTEVANFDYQAFYFSTENYTGQFTERGPEGKQGWFRYEEARKQPMFEGDRRILDMIARIPAKEVFEGVVVYNGTALESATFLRI